jgi:hypothetical protein
MTITINGPDGSTFNFPDDTAPDVIRGAMANHYGPPQAPSNPIAAAAGAHPDDTRFSPESMDVKAAVRGVPIVGPAIAERASAALSTLAHPYTGVGSPTYAENLEAERKAREAYEAAHPIRSAASQAVGGTLALGGVGGVVPGAARVLGMVGPLRQALPLGTLSGAALSAADAAARGESPEQGAVTGALTGAGGVLLGKGAGKVWDAARGMFRDPVQTSFINVNGRMVPVPEPVITRDPVAAGKVQDMLGTGVKTATDAEAETKAAMAAAHQDVVDRLDPTGASIGAQPFTAGQNAVDELVQQEQQRAAAEVARIAGARQQTAQLAQGVGGGVPGPMTTQDVGQTVGQRIRDLFTGARQATRAAYDTAANVPASYNPRYLIRAGDTIRQALDTAPGNMRVRISPEVTPQAQAALNTIDQEIAQLRFTNDVARGARPITPADMEQVRKQLVIQRRLANNAARMSGNWEDARAVGRVINAFDAWEQATATRPGGLLTGDPADVVSTRMAARAAHAAERARFSRQGPGDQVGTFMENVIGKYPGQEMSPQKIVRTLMGTPDNPAANENAAPILNHLRDNVFGANSPEWGAIKSGMISRMAETPPGGEQPALNDVADRFERFLGNQRHANAILSPAEQAQLQAHANNLRGAADIPPAKGTVQDWISRLGANDASGEEFMAKLMSKKGPQLAAELRNMNITPETMAQLKVAIWRRVSEAPEGMIPWQAQKSSQQISKFLNTQLARAIYSPNELAMMRAIQSAHEKLIPLPRTVNTSGSWYRASKALDALKKQAFQTMGAIHGGAHGYVLGKAADWAKEKIADRMMQAEATRLFRGTQPRLRPSIAPQAAFTTLGQLPALRDQSR